MFRNRSTTVSPGIKAISSRLGSRALLSLECLEGREVPASFSISSQGVFTIDMSDATDQSVWVNGVKNGFVVINSRSTTFKASQIRKIVVNGSEGHDQIDLKAVNLSNFKAMVGNDQITNTNAAVIINGKGDRDTIYGSAFNDLIFAGAGDDRVSGNLGSDRIFGQGGHDLIYADGNSLVNDTRGGNDFIDGGSGNDTIWGCGGNDAILGGTGKDVVHGGHGNDRVDGGDHNDKLYGDWGNDTVIGGQGADYLNGGHDSGNTDLDIGYFDSEDQQIPGNFVNFES